MEATDLPLGAISIALDYSEQAYKGMRLAKHYKCWWTSAEAYLHTGKRKDILVFKGTSSPLDFLINATAFPVPAGAGWSHAGFTLSHWSIWRKIKKDLTPGKPLIITGHSLGGGMAERSCALLTAHTDLHLITFGKPNVFLKGTAPGMKHLKRQISVVSGSDIIARLPRYLYAPSQEQTMLYLANDGSFHVDPEREYLKADWDKRGALADHSLSEYRSRFMLLMGTI